MEKGDRNRIRYKIKINKYIRDFPGGPVVKNPPSNAGDVGSIPGWGTKVPHATGQLSLHATTTEPTRSRACEPQLERSPRTTVKSLQAAMKDPTGCNEDPMCCN